MPRVGGCVSLFSASIESQNTPELKDINEQNIKKNPPK